MLRRTMAITVCLVFLSTISAVRIGAESQDRSEQRKEHEQATEKKLTELNKKMDELAAGFRKTEDESRTELNRLYDEFKKEHTVARKDLEEMRKATNEEWDEMKVKMNKSVEDLNRLYEQARSGNKKEHKPADAAK